MNGLLVVDKPVGVTSRRVVDVVRRLSRERAVGHAGTLDPLASGVLVLALGASTRLLEYVIGHDKRYVTTVVLGATSATDDGEGPVTVSDPAPAFTCEQIERVVATFRGTLVQRPPSFSAVSVGGQRLYQLARAGRPIEAPARQVHIYSMDVMRWASPYLELAIHCSKGTYIRSLGRDLGVALGCGGYLGGLRRTAVGSFTLDASRHLDVLEDDPGQVCPSLLSPLRALQGWQVIQVDATDTAALRQGKFLMGEKLPPSGSLAAAVDESGQLVAVLRSDADAARWQPVKVFPLFS